MTRSDNQRDPRRAPVASPPVARRSWKWASAVALAAACLLGWLWLGRADDLVDKTLEMQRTLLAGEASGRAGKRAVDEIIRNVDRMQPDELREVQQTLDAEWRRARAADIEAYFAAQTDERQSILDRSIDRAVIYRELRFAVNPKAWSREGRKPRKPRTAPPGAQTSAGATAADKKAQQQLRERYDDALRQRARERRIELPAWQ